MTVITELTSGRLIIFIRRSATLLSTFWDALRTRDICIVVTGRSTDRMYFVRLLNIINSIRQESMQNSLSVKLKQAAIGTWSVTGNPIDLSAAFWLAAFLVIWTTPSYGATPPNILIILADDMGYGDLGCAGSQTLLTPHLDELANSGVRCTAAYVASAVCSPSRAGLLTGRDPRRFGYQANLNANANNYTTRPDLLGLPPNEKTLADHLKAAGYRTGLVGKWHLGTAESFHPNRRGFDYFCGMVQGGHNYFPETVDHTIERNGTKLDTFSSSYLTDFFTDECVEFITPSLPKENRKPWFLFASYNAPHTPMQATDSDLQRFQHIKDKRRRTYAAMVYALDRGIGRIRKQLRETGQWKNTLCVFFSDNGGATNNSSWNGPLRGVKGCLREGGIRVPMIWTWPTQLPAGKVCESVVSSLDLLPTFMEAAGSEVLPLESPMSHEDAGNRRRMNSLTGDYDGVNLLPVLKDPATNAHRRLYWRLQGQAAILDGTDKVTRLSHRRAQMHRVASDLGEANDLSSVEVTRTNELLNELGEWEFAMPTMPAWGSSPRWNGQSAKHYDDWLSRPEPGLSGSVQPEP